MVLYLKFQLTWITFCCMILAIFIYTQKDLSHMKEFTANFHGSMSCYFEKSQDRLPDISEANIRGGRSIFFHETSCTSLERGKLTLSPRQACAVESAARLNPNMDVYLTFLSPGLLKAEEDEIDYILHTLVSYKNVKLHHLDYEKYLAGTPLEDLYEQGEIVDTPNAQSHVREVLKYLTLHKFGGIYLDLDVIVIKPFENLEPNFASISHNNQAIASGVLGFGSNQSGRDYTTKCLEELKYSFQKSSIGVNTSNTITKVLMEACGTQNLTDIIQNCNDFKLYPSEAFYPLTDSSWPMYFDPYQMLEVFERAKDSYTLYLWGEQNKQEPITVHTQTAYAVLQEVLPESIRRLQYGHLN